LTQNLIDRSSFSARRSRDRRGRLRAVIGGEKACSAAGARTILSLGEAVVQHPQDVTAKAVDSPKAVDLNGDVK
jgi:hypothetical protein